MERSRKDTVFGLIMNEKKYLPIVLVSAITSVVDAEVWLLIGVRVVWLLIEVRVLWLLMRFGMHVWIPNHLIIAQIL